MAEEKKKTARLTRHKRVRRLIQGTEKRPRLCVFRSNRGLYVQAVDDGKGRTLAAASTLDKNFKGVSSKKDAEAAKQLGTLIAQKLKTKKVEEVVFDRAGYKYHGRVKALAESARQSGLKF